MADTTPLQVSLFEEDYLLRSLGPIVHSPDIALTELVANAWDAGAAKVAITIPDERGGALVIEDDGTGMTSEQFRRRWMMLGYNRARHQGRTAEFPPERADWSRPAYGRNGVGRHGLLCFASEYTVTTWRDGLWWEFKVSTASGQQPFVLLSERQGDKATGHGTKLEAVVERNLPSPDRIRTVLSARFLADPRFSVAVNGQSVPLAEHEGLVDREALGVTKDMSVEAFFIDSTRAARKVQHQGIAFWVAGRLVGSPSWTLGQQMVLDGRTRIAKSHTVVVMANEDLIQDVLPDWTGFRSSPTIEALFAVVGSYVEKVVRKLSSETIQDTKEAILRENRKDIENLSALGRFEIEELVDEMTARQPTISPEVVSVAVQAAIRIEKARRGAALLEKLARLPDEDIASLDRLLGEWSVRDALTVLDEIDRRLMVVEAMRRLSGDDGADELHALHPLVTESRWLFGPEFDSPEYSSNESLRTAMFKLFGKRVDSSAFLNPRKRPDLVILEDATLSAVATEEIAPDTNLATMRDILVIELKRGNSEIGREEVHQAEDYVQDLFASGHLDGAPRIQAFVVGHRIDSKTARQVKLNDDRGVISAATYHQLVRTADARLLRLRDKLRTRYEEVSGTDLLRRVLGEPEQLDLSDPGGETSL